MDIIDRIGQTASLHPDRPAHIWRENVLTYGQLWAQSEHLANFLIQKFGEDRSPLIVCGQKENQMLSCFLGCIKAGHAYIPVDSSMPADRIGAIVQDSKAKLMICADDLAAPAQTEVLGGAQLEEILGGDAGAPDTSFRVKENEVYYIIYTSGSTGRPKGVQITMGNLHSFLRWAKTLGGLPSRKDHVFLNVAPFSFDLSVMDTYLSLSTGSTLFSIDRGMVANPKELFAALGASGATVIVCTPSFADLCLADSSFNSALLPRLQCFLFCGETLTNRTADSLLKRFPGVQVVNLYGPTETTVSVTAVVIDRDICDHISPLPVGRAKDDCELMIVDAGGNPVEDGVHGEIIIVGESVSIGYFGNPQMTQRSFFTVKGQRAYRTGDEGYLKDGMLYFCGRMDFQIKLNGFRIEIEDIENNIRRLDDISNAVVVPVVSNGEITHLAAFVMPSDPNADRSLKGAVAFRNRLKQLLPEYMIPKKIVFTDSFPTNQNGKIDRKALANGVK